MISSQRTFIGLTGILLLSSVGSFVGCSDPGGAAPSNPTAEPAKAPAANEDVEGRAQAQSDLILGGGAGVEYGYLGREAFEAQSVHPEVIHPDVGTTWSELAALPAVTSAYSFALAVSDVDSKAHLGFMFTDATYEAQLQSHGVLWVGDGAYFGANAVALYGFTGTGTSTVWTPYQGRYTPQTYAFSELRYDSGSSYYTTNYASFGGLISVIKDGGKGVYAVTPASTTARSHSVAFNGHVLYALAAQASIGLTLSTTPISSFGNLSDLWVDKATIETSTAAASLPELIDAGGTLVGAYIVGGGAKIRATMSPSTVTTAANFIPIGTCASATRVDIAYAGGLLYKACISSSGALSVQKANISNLSSVSWTTVTTGVSGTVTDLDLTGQGTVISLAVRQSTSVKVFTAVTDTTPSFNMVLPGTFALQAAAEGLVLSVCDLAGTTKQVRTFLK
jgi:hypothetical protein